MTVTTEGRFPPEDLPTNRTDMLISIMDARHVFAQVVLRRECRVAFFALNIIQSMHTAHVPDHRRL